MAVTSTDTKTGPYTGNGATTVFPFTFDVVGSEDVAVLVDGLPLNTGAYSVDAANKAIILSAPLPGGSVLYVVSEPSFEQQIQFENGSRWLADPVNEANDRAAIRALWLKDRVERAPQLPFIPTDASGLFPTVDADGKWVFTPSGPGAPGPGAYFRATLELLKSAPITDRVSLYDNSPWFFTGGDFAGRADDATIVAANGVSLTVGAWVRQDGTAVTFRATSTAPARNLQTKAAEGFVTPKDFGAIGNGVASDAAAFVLMFAAAQATGRVAWVPDGTYIIDQALTVPAGVHVRIDGVLQGVGTSGKLSVSGASMISFGDRGLLRNVQMILTSGSPRIYHPACTGYNHLSLILIQGESTYKDVLIRGAYLYEGNYGILRQGIGSSSDGLQIIDTKARDLVSDAIELNVVVYDINTLIDGVDILTINGSVQPNWGIGVGVAGLTYSAGYDTDKTTSRFTIRNVRGAQLRQLVHVECASDFVLENIEGYDVSSAYSTSSGMDVAVVAIYGCTRYKASGIRHNGPAGSNGTILMLSGVKNGQYVCPCSDFILDNVDLPLGGIQAEIGGNYAYFRDIVVPNGGIALVGRAIDTRFEDVHATRPTNVGVAMFLNCNGSGDGRDAFLPANSRLTMRSWSARNSGGAQNWIASITNFSTVDVEPVTMSGGITLTASTAEGPLWQGTGSTITFAGAFLLPPVLDFQTTAGLTINGLSPSATGFTPKGFATANGGSVTGTWFARGVPL